MRNVNALLRHLCASEVIGWAAAQTEGAAVVSTSFRPYEAVLLHLVTRVLPGIPVLWVDHGFNRPATYRHAELLRDRLKLNLHAFVPRVTAAHYAARHGGPPAPDDEAALRAFSAQMKLEPFGRGMAELAPQVWFTGLRRAQNPGRAALDIVTRDEAFGTLKVSPLFHWSDAELEAYLAAHGLPNEWDYFDPAKADEQRECGLHAAWGAPALAAA